MLVRKRMKEMEQRIHDLEKSDEDLNEKIDRLLQACNMMVAAVNLLTDKLDELSSCTAKKKDDVPYVDKDGMLDYQAYKRKAQARRREGEE